MIKIVQILFLFMLVAFAAMHGQTNISGEFTVVGTTKVYVSQDSNVDSTLIKTGKVVVMQDNLDTTKESQDVISPTNPNGGNPSNGTLLTNADESSEIVDDTEAIAYTETHQERTSHHVKRQKTINGEDSDEETAFQSVVASSSSTKSGRTLHVGFDFPDYTNKISINSYSFTHTKSKSYPHYSVLYSYENGTAILKPPTKDVI